MFKHGLGVNLFRLNVVLNVIYSIGHLICVKHVTHGPTLYDHICMTYFVWSYIYLTHSYTHCHLYDETWPNIIWLCMIIQCWTVCNRLNGSVIAEGGSIALKPMHIERIVARRQVTDPIVHFKHLGVLTSIMNSADRVRRLSTEFIIALNTPNTSGLIPALF